MLGFAWRGVTCLGASPLGCAGLLPWLEASENNLHAAAAENMEQARHLRGLPQKRSRSWEVDVSLEELVSWDVLDQFMGDMPAEPINVPEQPRDLPVGVAILPPSSAAPPASSSFTGSSSSTSEGSTSHPNAASLAQSLYSGWQQGSVPWQGALGFGAMSWGTEFLSGTLAGEDASLVSGEFEGPDDGEADSPRGPGSGDRPVHKQRFVWTAELHRRFEAAVNTLGIDHAKPQAISQLMNCEGEGAPTRQNIKSHLQKCVRRRSKGVGATSKIGSLPPPKGSGLNGACVRPPLGKRRAFVCCTLPTNADRATSPSLPAAGTGC